MIGRGSRTGYINLILGLQEYWTEVFSDLIEDYQAGLTPNPDVLCNSRIKERVYFNFCINKCNNENIILIASIRVEVLIIY